MPKGIFLALANAASDDIHDEFNTWYDDVHMREVLALPGVKSARRFKLASSQIIQPISGSGQSPGNQGPTMPNARSSLLAVTTHMPKPRMAQCPVSSANTRHARPRSDRSSSFGWSVSWPH